MAPGLRRAAPQSRPPVRRWRSGGSGSPFEHQSQTASEEKQGSWSLQIAQGFRRRSVAGLLFKQSQHHFTSFSAIAERHIGSSEVHIQKLVLGSDADTVLESSDGGGR